MLDAHLHVVDPGRIVPDITGNPSGSWWNVADARPDVVVGRLAAAGVEGGVFVQAVGAHGLADNSVALEAAAAHGGFAAMATVDPSGADPVAALDAAAASGATGLRLFSVPTPADPWLGGDLARCLLERCGELAVTPAVCCLPAELPVVDELLGAFPGLEVVLDHAGFVAIGGADEQLVELARHDNLVVKLTTDVFDHSSLSPASAARRLIDVVGADRIAWGSDHPQVHDRSYGELVTLAEQATDSLPGVQQAAILGRTTARLWLDRRSLSRSSR